MIRIALFLIAATSLLAADWEWTVPHGFPRPQIPADNPMTAAKVELGRHLFYDKRMSVNGKQSCASCHRQELAFTDGRARAQGTTGQFHPRSSMSLVNVSYAPMLTWAHPTLDSLEEQALVPMLGDEPIELGLKGREEEFLTMLGHDPVYRRLFPKAFAGDNQITLKNVAKAIAAFERSIVSMRSPYDRYRWGGEVTAISEAGKRGEDSVFLKRTSRLLPVPWRLEPQFGSLFRRPVRHGRRRRLFQHRCIGVRVAQPRDL